MALCFWKKYETTIDAYCFGQMFVLFACFKKVQLYWSFTIWSWQRACKRGDAIHYVLFISKFVPILHFFSKFEEIISLFHGKRLIILSKV